MSEYDLLKKKYRVQLVPCEICHSHNTKHFHARGRSEEPGTYGNVPVRVCNHCGHLMINPRYEDGFYKEYYELMYREVAFGSEKPSATYLAQQKDRGKAVLDYFKKFITTRGVMLDHGCASGCTMQGWVEEGWCCFGGDPHRPSVELGNSLGFNVKIGAGEELPFKDQSFDLVLSLGSLEHSYDINATMMEINRTLNNEGYLVIRWRSNVIYGSPLEYFNHNHNRFFSPKTFKLLLLKFGFEIVNESDEKHEGWDSYSYLIARKSSEAIDQRRIDELIKSGICENSDALITNKQKTCAVYYRRSKQFKDIFDKRNGEATKIMEDVKKQSLDWGFLGGDPKQAVDRSYMEATAFIFEYESGLVT